MRKWLCIRNCQFPGQHRRRAGHVYEFEDSVVPPHHFRPFDEPKEDKAKDVEKQPNIRMRRDELVEMAAKRGIVVTEDMTKKDIVAILDKQEKDWSNPF